MKLRTYLIHTDGGTQPRAGTDQRTVTEYAQDMLAGVTFPPVVVFNDGADYWLADGFHRVLAARVANLENVEADVRMGTQRDALLYACGANAEHGMRRTNDDKRRAVTRLLEDDEWSKWSDREIAKKCRVGHSFVSELRSSLSTVDSEPDERTYTTKHGTTATMDTARIGKTRPKPELVEEPEDDEPEQDAGPAVDSGPEEDPIAVFKGAVGIILRDIPVDTARHMVINEMIKYLRGLSIEMNRKAGVA